MRRALLLAVLLVASCAPRSEDGDPYLPRDANPDSTIAVWHDDARAVTCWVYHDGYAGGISCIPDSQLLYRLEGWAR